MGPSLFLFAFNLFAAGMCGLAGSWYYAREQIGAPFWWLMLLCGANIACSIVGAVMASRGG